MELPVALVRDTGVGRIVIPDKYLAGIILILAPVSISRLIFVVPSRAATFKSGGSDGTVAARSVSFPNVNSLNVLEMSVWNLGEI